MQKLKKFFYKHGITAWLIASVLLLASFISYAEYVEQQNRVKRVVANTSESGQMFASDYLVVGSPAARKIPISENEEACIIDFKIWNYDPADAVKYYDRSLTYTLTAQLVDGSGTKIIQSALGNREIGIKKNADESYTMFNSYDAENGYMITFSGLNFPGTTKGEHKYQVKYDKSMLTDGSNIYVKLTATPDRTQNRDLNPITATLGVTSQVATLVQGWSGEFNDDKNFNDYDGFNYVISGNGEMRLTLRWRPDRLEINKYFLEDIAGDLQLTNGEAVTVMEQEGITWKCVTINAKSEDTIVDGEVQRKGVNRYDIQFYMTNSDMGNYTNWNDVKDYVILEKSGS